MKHSKVSAIQQQFIANRLAFGDKQVSERRTKYVAYLKPAMSPASTLAEMNVTILPDKDGQALCGVIGDFGVRPKFRNYGLARSLMNHVLSIDTLPEKLVLYAKPSYSGQDSISQLQLEKFYHSFGFKHTGQRSYDTKYPGVEMILDRDKPAAPVLTTANLKGLVVERTQAFREFSRLAQMSEYERFRAKQGWD